MNSPKTTSLHEETRVQWYVVRDGRESLHLHIYSRSRDPLGRKENRHQEKTRDFSKVLPSQLESYLRMSLQSVGRPYDESGTRDEFHLTYDYSNELYQSLNVLVDEIDASSHSVMTSDRHRVEEWI